VLVSDWRWRGGQLHRDAEPASVPWGEGEDQSILLAVTGGVIGLLAGVAATAVYASSKSWAVVIPVEAWSGGIASAIFTGGLAGVLPAVRASRIPPAVALRTV
jgi:putative ABC transport system permease protein